jgi:hypothetical protein
MNVNKIIMESYTDMIVEGDEGTIKFEYGTIVLEKGYTQEDLLTLLDEYKALKEVDCQRVLVSDLSEGDVMYIRVSTESGRVVPAKGKISDIDVLSHATGEVTIHIDDIDFTCTLEKSDTVIAPK